MRLNGSWFEKKKYKVETSNHLIGSQYGNDPPGLGPVTRVLLSVHFGYKLTTKPY